jgi:uncharacterized protein
MIPRAATSHLQQLRRGFPVVALTGPRQSGKTTLARMACPDKPYVSLENPDMREFAEKDPKRFLQQFASGGGVIDEIQRVPALLSWLQGWVDERKIMGDVVITGSAQLDLLSGISQSLAGRVGRVELLPLSLKELYGEPQKEAANFSIDRFMWAGGYPALYDAARDLTPTQWHSNYLATYVERDARQLINVRDLAQFQRFIRLCAARSGQILNASSLGADAGISAQTARAWLSALETSYLVKFVAPYYNNFGKRITKAPKLYFLDTGLLCYLLGIADEKALSIHSARGAIFETWVVSELLKNQFNTGISTPLYYWRGANDKEVDMLIETPQGLRITELKSGATVSGDWLKALLNFPALVSEREIIYGGDESYERQGVHIRSWRSLA